MVEYRDLMHRLAERLDTLVEEVAFWRDHEFSRSLNEAEEDVRNGRTLSPAELRASLSEDHTAVPH
jgi:hypothetical protein